MAFDPLLLAAGAVLFVGGATALRRTADELRLLATVLRTGPSAPGTVEEGMVVVSGVARPTAEDGTVEAPFTGTTALAVACEVREEHRDSPGTHAVEADDRSVPFRVVADDGTALVVPVDADRRLDEEVLAVAGGEAPPDRVRESLAGTDLDASTGTLDLGAVGVDTGRDREYVEGRLEPGEPVSVLGQATVGGGYDADVVLADGPDVPGLLVADAGHRRAVLRVVASAGSTGALGALVLALGVAAVWVAVG